MSDSTAVKNHAAFIWSVADLLRGDYKQSEYGKVILPLTVLRRLDCVLEPTKAKVLARYNRIKGSIDNVEPVLCNVAGEQFYNLNPLDLPRLLDDPGHLAANLRAYIAGFSSGARDVLEKFDFDTQIARLDKANLLYQVIGKFAEIDLHPNTVSNLEMGYLYEELIRRFSELSNETAGEHFTPREVIRLMVNLLFAEDEDALTKPGTVRTLFDPACGTGGMLSVAEDYLRQLNPGAQLEVFGQELNEETYAICRSDMMLKGQDASHITVGNSFNDDGQKGRTFDYCLANPPFGVEWKKVETDIRKEHDQLGFRGRFGAGLPRINDGSFLFLQHMMAKMKPVEEGGSRLAIVFNGSPLFTGLAGSGESEIRRWIIENDWLEAVIALPDQLFYNTGISTYFWIVTNRKSEERRGKVQLVDARELFTKMRKSLGNKRYEISIEQIDEITRLYADFSEGEQVKILSNEAFGYMRINVERPLKVNWVLYDATASDIAKSRAWKAFSSTVDDLSAEDFFGVAGPFDFVIGKQWDSAAEMREALLKACPEFSTDLLKEVLKAAAQSNPDGVLVTDKKGHPQPDPDLRDNENVRLPMVRVKWERDVTERLETPAYRSSVAEFVNAEVLPYAADAWVDHDKTILGYEIPLTRIFYKYVPPRLLTEIDAEMKELEGDIQDLLEVMAKAVSSQRAGNASLSQLVIDRDSSVDARLPVGWSESRLDHEATVHARIGWKALTASEYVDEGYAFLSTTNLRGDSIDFENVNFITEFRWLESPELQLREDDVLMTKDGAGIGWTAVVRSVPRPSTVNGSIAVIRPKSIDGRFLYYVLSSDAIQTLVSAFKSGMGVPHLFQADLKKFPLLKPSIAEQVEIADFLDKETSRIDAVIMANERSIALLKERRQALITAAVTGRLEIPENAHGDH